MRVKLNLTLFLTVISLALLAVMYQETPAQPRRVAANRIKVATTQTAAPEISYRVSMSKPWTHLLEVEMRLRWSTAPARAELKMPVWTPGSYLIREYARHVQDFAAENNSGQKLTWEKVNKNTWHIDTGGAKEIVVRYRVYSNELTVRTNELNDEHAFWNNGALLMFPAGHLNAKSTVCCRPGEYVSRRQLRHTLRFAVRSERLSRDQVRRARQTAPVCRDRRG